MPGFLERDEGEREPPYEKYPWDGVSGVRPYRGFASTTTVGVYSAIDDFWLVIIDSLLIDDC